MSPARGRARPLFALACLVGLLTVALWQFAAGGAGAAGGGELVGEPAFGAPARTFLGASPLEAPGEVWASGVNGRTLARYTDAGGWQSEPAPVDTAGRPIEGLSIEQSAGAGRTTPNGGVLAVASGIDADAEGAHALLLLREPGGTARELPAPPSELLGPNQTFLEEGRLPLLAPFEAPAGHTGAFVVRFPTGFAAQGVLSYLDGAWTRELVCIGTAPGPLCATPPSEFRALAIAAEGGEAWMLTSGAEPGEGIELFRREATGGPGGTPVWRQQLLGSPGSLGSRYAQEAPLGVPLAARLKGQPLTVTEKGVWFDAQLSAGGESQPATAYYDIGQEEVTASWCDVQAPAGLCTYPLGSELAPQGARSFAWPPQGATQPFGQRVVTGIGQGAILSLSGTGFERVSLAGGEAGGEAGAALSAPDQGWLGGTPPIRLTRSPEAAHLTAWPVPFRRPLTAIAAEPGAPVAALDSEALAVGAAGQVARYIPGQGWEPESLLTSSGRRATPTLRGVAWPETGRAFAVGDGGAMWVWQKATGLWQTDPAQPPTLVRANFTGIAFDPTRPSRGYAIGKQGLLLRYGRTWTQEQLPTGVPAEANFTSIAFAGKEAIATWKFIGRDGNGKILHPGGVIVNDGSGWKVDQGAVAALGEATPQQVAGLPDGGAVIAAVDSKLIERQSSSAPWLPAAGGSPGYPASLAAFREGGQVRALITVALEAPGDGGEIEQVENQPPPGQAPLLLDPYPLPGSGLLLRQTAGGWRDEQHQAYPLPAAVAGRTTYDLPGRPDPLLALLVNPDGSQGWAVGGETGTSIKFEGEAVQTADVMRYGPAAAPPSNLSQTAIGAAAGTVSFAVGGNAACGGPCADLTGTGIAPDRWLRSAVGTAAAIGGLRSFLYTGPGVAAGGAEFSERLSATLSPAAFAREEQAYARRLGTAAGGLPTFAAPAESDVDRAGSLTAFQSAFSGFGAPFGSAPAGAGITPLSAAGPGQGYYSFASAGNGGTVRVIVLDYSYRSLGDPQRCWLAGQLSAAGAAGTPALVVGGRDLARQAPNAAEDSGQVVPILASGAFPAGCAPSGPPAAASAYLFDYPGQNRAYSLISGGRSVPAYGSGTLGYVAPPQRRETDFVGAGGFLVAAVNVAARNVATNVAPVSVRLIPDIGGLALNALDGTLLRRSRPALFEALARRPLAGSECIGNDAPLRCEVVRPDPYVPIPSECRGTRCATAVMPEYTFTSSDPDIADFVKPDPASLNPRNVLLVDEKPVLDSQSGLLCAFNAGTTTVTVSTGGYAYSQKVTVQAGSVQRPCGTTPLRHRTVAEATPTPTTPPLAPAPTPAPLPTLPPPPPSPPAATPSPLPAPPHPATPPPPAPLPALFVPLMSPALPIVPIVPPPPAPAFPPTPPSGTSPVSATEREEEEEEAYESAQSMVAVRLPGPASGQLSYAPDSSKGGGLPRALPLLALLAAIAAAGGASGIRRRTSRLRPAYQSTDFRRYR